MVVNVLIDWPETIMPTTLTADQELFRQDRAPANEAHSSGVSWGAVMGGAFVAAAFYMILLALGAGFGLSAVSPWSRLRISRSLLVNLF